MPNYTTFGTVNELENELSEVGSIKQMPLGGNSTG
jgi:hypothetical protein